MAPQIVATDIRWLRPQKFADNGYHKSQDSLLCRWNPYYSLTVAPFLVSFIRNDSTLLGTIICNTQWDQPHKSWHGNFLHWYFGCWNWRRQHLLPEISADLFQQLERSSEAARGKLYIWYKYPFPMIDICDYPNFVSAENPSFRTLRSLARRPVMLSQLSMIPWIPYLLSRTSSQWL